jgi:hypothetical protein
VSSCEDTTLNCDPEFVVEGFTNPDVVVIGAQTAAAGAAIRAVANQPNYAVMSP